MILDYESMILDSESIILGSEFVIMDYKYDSRLLDYNFKIQVCESGPIIQYFDSYNLMYVMSVHSTIPGCVTLVYDYGFSRL